MRIPVTDLSDPVFAIFHTLHEAQLRHYFEPHGGLFIAESAKVASRALDAGCVPHSMLLNENLHTEEASSFLARLENEYDIPVYTAPEAVMKQITGYHLTGGLLLAMYRPGLPSPEALIAGARRIVVLENVTNPTNAGAIIRSAAALGMDAVLFREGSADPLNRRAIRVSMGCVFQIPWTYTDDYTLLKDHHFHCVAMALRDDTRSLRDPSLHTHEKIAVFMGAEGDGLSPETISFCDDTVCIPMMHGVDSLNVAAASAVAFWELGLPNN